MSTLAKTDTQPDWKGIARANRFQIPEEEIGRIAEVVGPLVAECRKAFDEELGLVEPVGTFRPDEF
jgi:hypothetical protein